VFAHSGKHGETLVGDNVSANGNSVGDFSSGKCDRTNDMQKAKNCLLLKSDS
jgi:hypothetical protein